MTFRWREHEQAHAELREAALYLDEVREGWGHKFTDAVEAAIESILESPNSWGLHGGKHRSPQVHSRGVAGFRYSIKYIAQGDEVVIIAYAHERRHPDYWAQRLSD